MRKGELYWKVWYYVESEENEACIYVDRYIVSAVHNKRSKWPSGPKAEYDYRRTVYLHGYDSTNIRRGSFIPSLTPNWMKKRVLNVVDYRVLQRAGFYKTKLAGIKAQLRKIKKDRYRDEESEPFYKKAETTLKRMKTREEKK